MLKVEIKSSFVEPRTLNVKNGPNAGKQMTFHEQEAWVYLCSADGKPQPYPQRITLNIDVDRQQPPYPVGVYQVSPRSFYVDRFNALTVGRLILDTQATVARAA